MTVIVYANVQYGNTNGDVRLFQQALITRGYGIPAGATSYFGDQTKTACARYQDVHLGYGSGIPGPLTFGLLGFTEGTQPPAPSGEPAQNMTRTTYGGHTVNERTKVMLQAAAVKFGRPFALMQGSYNPGGVSASAGTHDAGGVVDVATYGMTTTERSVNAVRALRQVGFAAWLRTPSEGFVYHIHACAIGDKEMAPVAKQQVQSYFNGRNGLANNGRDTAPSSVGRPYPAWAGRYDL